MTEVELYNDILSIIDSYVDKIGSDHRGIDEDQNCLVTDEVVALVKNHIALDLVVCCPLCNSDNTTVESDGIWCNGCDEWTSTKE